MQKNLENQIIETKGLHGKDLTANTFASLQVELGEFANEGRWFKHWSEDQEPRTTDLNWYVVEDTIEQYGDSHHIRFEAEVYRKRRRNPLLEEFADSLHFFLSIAIQKGWENALYIHEEQLDPDEWNGNLTGYYLEMTYFLNTAYIRKYSEEQEKYSQVTFGLSANQFDFRMAWICFLNIGINGFGLTLKQIEQAYFDKNKVNHERQESGY